MVAALIVAHAANDAFEGNSYHLMQAGVAVEAFFIISGCLLCRSAARDAARSTRPLGQDTASFLWRKARSLIPPFVVAISIYACCWYVDTGAALLAGGGIGDFCRQVLRWVPNFLLVYMAGILQDEVLVNIVWYVSAMLIAMLVVYPLVRTFGQTYTMVVAPFSALMLLGYLCNSGVGNINGTTGYLDFMPSGLMRAFIGINLGCVAYELARWLSGLNLTALSRLLLACAVLMLLVVFVCVMEFGESEDRVAMVLLLPFLIGILFSRQAAGSALLDNRVSTYLGRASMYIYLYHTPVRQVLVTAGADVTYLQAAGIMFLGSFAMFVVTDLVERLWRWVSSRYDLHPLRLFVRS